jgi:hypothetical protein
LPIHWPIKKISKKKINFCHLMKKLLGIMPLLWSLRDSILHLQNMCPIRYLGFKYLFQQPKLTENCLWNNEHNFNVIPVVDQENLSPSSISFQKLWSSQIHKITISISLIKRLLFHKQSPTNISAATFYEKLQDNAIIVSSDLE